MELENHLADAFHADVLAQLLAFAGADAPKVERQRGDVHEVKAVLSLGDVLDEHRQAIGAHGFVPTHVVEVLEHVVDAAPFREDAVARVRAVVHDGAEAHKVLFSNRGCCKPEFPATNAYYIVNA